LAKDPALKGQLEATLASLVRQIARQTIHLAPFMPGKAAELWGQLGAPGRVEEQRFSTLQRLDPGGWRVAKGAPLFPKEDQRGQAA
jgi:methionyl-tRNA synthetase